MRPRVVITGLGVLACNGIGRAAFWDALKNGRSGIRHIDRFDASELPCQIAGQLWDFNPEDYMKKCVVRNWFRHVHQAIAASRLALEDAHFSNANHKDERIAVAMGTSVGSPNEEYEAHQEAYETRGYRNVGKLTSSKFTGHSATVHVTVDFGFRGPAITIGSGCATGLDVLGWGLTQIRLGRADAALVGATETPIFPMSIATACCLGILSTRNDEPEKAMRPFDQNRDGIVLSEAAVSLVLEREDHAKARGAPVLGEVAGLGAATEGQNPLILDPEGRALARAVGAALQDAGMSVNDVDHIESHGVSLEMYDHSETKAYKRAFGDTVYRIPISAVKSMTGQPYAVAGLIGAAAALLSLNEGVIPPTLNLDHPDPVCDLDYVPKRPRLNDVNAVLVSAMSFGGNHGAAILRRAN